MLDPRAPEVARRAAEMALAAGSQLGDDLALWAMAGGRPICEPVHGRPEELGALLESATGAVERRAFGAHFTPERLASGLVERAIGARPSATVCDPSCGGGALLLAAARHLAAMGGDPLAIVNGLWGADTDPLAVATTEAALALWAGSAPHPGNLVVADMLLDPPDWGRFDVVVGNPPFLSQMGSATSRTSGESARLRERFGGAVQAYTDPAALFLLLGCQLARRGGSVAMVQPQSVLGARDATAARSAVDDRAALREVWVPEHRSFAAAVDVCVTVFDVDVGPAPPRPWTAHLARALGVPAIEVRPGPTVGDEAEAAAAFRAEYYGIAPHVHEASDLPSGRPLLTTGLVDLGGTAWGQRRARMAGRSWTAPVVDVDALDGRAAAWARRAAAPKLIIATQTRVVEVVVDGEGRFVPGVPLVVAFAPAERLWGLAAALASPPITAWAASRAAGTALSAGALELTARLVREAPLPSDADAWKAGAAALERGDLEEFAATMTAAYGCGPDVTAWWLARVGSVWSGAGSTR